MGGMHQKPLVCGDAGAGDCLGTPAGDCRVTRETEPPAVSSCLVQALWRSVARSLARSEERISRSNTLSDHTIRQSACWEAR
jgi:hypothetical protein